MSHTKKFSVREKALVAIVAVLLVAVGVVGYSQASAQGGANLLIAQDATQVKPTATEPVKESDTENQQRQIKDQNNWLKNMQRELQDIKRQAKTLDTSTADSLFAQFAACIQARQAEIGTQDFWSNIQDCQSSQRDIEDHMNDVLRPARDCANTKKNIEDRRREKKNIDSQLKDILRQDKNANVSALTTIIAQIDALFAQADQISASGTCSSDVRDTLNDIQNEFNGLFQDFYNSSNDVRQQANEGRQLQDNQRDYEKDKKARCDKDKARELKNFEKELNKAKKRGAGSEDMQVAYDDVKAIYTQMCVNALGAMKTALDSKDVEAYNEARSTFDELDRTFWETLNENRQGVQEKSQKAEQLKNVTRELKNWASQLKKMKVELNRIKKLYTRTAKKYASSQERKVELAAFADYVAQAESLIKQIEDGIATAKEESASDPDAWWMGRQDDLNDLQQQFNEMQQNVQMIGNVMQTLAQVEKGLMKGIAKELAQLKRESNNDPELMATLNDIIQQAKDALSAAWSQVVSSPEDAMMALEGIQDLGQSWEEAVNDWRENRDNQNVEEESNGW